MGTIHRRTSEHQPADRLVIFGISGDLAKVMTVAAAVLFPVVLAYQGWTYYVFRRRVGGAGTTTADAAAGPAGHAR